MNGQKTVDEYIAAFDDWRTDAMKRLREVVKEGAPHSAVGIKWAQPVWEWNGPMIWMKAYPKPRRHRLLARHRDGRSQEGA